jgi:hypothetical protein
MVNVFPQYNGDLKALATVEVPLVAMPEQAASSDSTASGGVPCL